MEGNLNRISTDFIIWFDKCISDGILMKTDVTTFWFKEDHNYYPIEEIFELYNRFRKN
jgi:hypothetical protein